MFQRNRGGSLKTTVCILMKNKSGTLAQECRSPAAKKTWIGSEKKNMKTNILQ